MGWFKIKWSNNGLGATNRKNDIDEAFLRRMPKLLPLVNQMRRKEPQF